MIKKAIKRIQMSLSRGIVRSIDDDNPIQLVKVSVLDNEVHDEIERLQNYGMSSKPTAPAEAAVLYFQGNRDDGIALAVDNSKSRPTGLKDDEVCFYSSAGQKILLKENGDIVFNDGSDFAVRFTALETALNTLQLNLNAFITIFNAHIHVLAPPATDPTETPATASAVNFGQAKIQTIKVPGVGE